ncbi:MAG: ribonuclease D [Candidatus Pelagibacter sp. TMED275]|nr:MAG: ribonuclease D [Candidatus Pelagibacter sp. TMED275]|tara:strand:+ start:1022 stop:1633 length:612 start_codon:yes stop_codon:yes gene_type:complete
MDIKIKLHKHDLPEDLNLGKSIAIDGEFGGLNPSKDKLCLIQISTGNNDAHIIQLDRETYKAPILVKILSDKSVQKIGHFLRADLNFIKHYLKTDVENIQDTKIQSKLARGYSDKHSLKDLIREFIGIEISKQYQSSDFGGDLSQKQLQYCANDVVYLHKIHDSLNKILIREDRKYLYDEAIKFMKIRVDLDLAFFKDDIWAH